MHRDVRKSDAFAFSCSFVPGRGHGPLLHDLFLSKCHSVSPAPRKSYLKGFAGGQLMQRPFTAQCNTAFIDDALFFTGLEM
jgi:hypothetical protein